MRTMINKDDALIMSLIHYFVTKENYTPIVVKGVENEIWLENIEGPYKIIRINSNYIHNDEQYNFDIFKTNSVVKQIKKKTFSLKMNVLNIFTNASNYVNLANEKNIDTISLKKITDFKNNNNVMSAFPDIIENTNSSSSLDLGYVFSVTDDINKKTNEDNQNYEKVFKPKKLLITYLLIVINAIMFFVTLFVSNGKIDAYSLALLGGNLKAAVLQGEYYRIITSAFLHGGYMHFLVNMYSLYIIGRDLETFLGKWKFLFVYLISAITGSLLSLVFASDYVVSIGASGAIFGLLGALLYFGYNYRLYLSSVLKQQIIPLIVVNLLIGFLVSDIDNACHIGGLIGGYIALKAIGVPNKSTKSDKINGIILLAIYFAFLIYALFFR